jgi:hypothetical protein
VEKICRRRHRATLQHYKATWTSLLTNEKAKSTFTRWLLRLNCPPTWALAACYEEKKQSPIFEGLVFDQNVHASWNQIAHTVNTTSPSELISKETEKYYSFWRTNWYFQNYTYCRNKCLPCRHDTLLFCVVISFSTASSGKK